MNNVNYRPLKTRNITACLSTTVTNMSHNVYYLASRDYFQVRSSSTMLNRGRNGENKIKKTYKSFLQSQPPARRPQRRTEQDCEQQRAERLPQPSALIVRLSPFARTIPPGGEESNVERLENLCGHGDDCLKKMF